MFYVRNLKLRSHYTFWSRVSNLDFCPLKNSLLEFLGCHGLVYLPSWEELERCHQRPSYIIVTPFHELSKFSRTDIHSHCVTLKISGANLQCGGDLDFFQFSQILHEIDFCKFRAHFWGCEFWFWDIHAVFQGWDFLKSKILCGIRESNFVKFAFT